jgi:hypothetical protein
MRASLPAESGRNPRVFVWLEYVSSALVPVLEHETARHLAPSLPKPTSNPHGKTNPSIPRHQMYLDRPKRFSGLSR